MIQQDSVNRAWEWFAHGKFRLLRKTICPTVFHMRRFREVFVTSVVATDLENAELNDYREARWEQVYDTDATGSSLALYNKEDCELMAILAVEHLMQASVVAHTMQHWP